MDAFLLSSSPVAHSILMKSLADNVTREEKEKNISNSSSTFPTYMATTCKHTVLSYPQNQSWEILDIFGIFGMANYEICRPIKLKWGNETFWGQKIQCLKVEKNILRLKSLFGPTTCDLSHHDTDDEFSFRHLWKFLKVWPFMFRFTSADNHYGKLIWKVCHLRWSKVLSILFTELDNKNKNILGHA